MPIEDAFWVGIPEELSSLLLRDLFERVFPSDESLQVPFRSRLDVRNNPDLPDMYDALVDIFARAEMGLCTVATYRNHGPKLADSSIVCRHLTRGDAPGVLDLVLEQRFSAIDYTVQRGDFPDVEAAMTWLSSRVLLYFLDTPDYTLSTAPLDDADVALLPIAQSLVDAGCIKRSAESGLFEITERGREEIHRMTAEAETAIERYEVFADVLYDPHTGGCDFGTGIGQDVRIPVYEAEALSPLRAVLFVDLHDGTLGRMAGDWRTVIRARAFFETLLLPVVERPLVDAEAVDAIIDAGFTLTEQQAWEASRQAEEAQLRRSLSRD